MFYFLNKKF